jgi:hypothetical protein
MLAMSEEQAADFYAKMDKPVKPMAEGVLGAAQEAQERPSVSRPQSSAPTVSRDVGAPGEAGEMTAQEFDEQRREEDRQLGNRGSSQSLFRIVR